MQTPVLESPDVITRYETVVNATTSRVMDSIRSADLARPLFVKVLFGIRALPRLPGLLIRRRPTELKIEYLADEGFVTLEETETSILLGAVGRFWRPVSPILRIDAGDFVNFNQPGFAKVTLDFKVEPREGGTLLSTTTNIQCIDNKARRAFRPYWLVVGPFSGLIRRAMLSEIKRVAESS